MFEATNQYIYIYETLPPGLNKSFWVSKVWWHRENRTPGGSWVQWNWYIMVYQASMYHLCLDSENIIGGLNAQHCGYKQRLHWRLEQRTFIFTH
jgi:hypothetical protein